MKACIMWVAFLAAALVTPAIDGRGRRAFEDQKTAYYHRPAPHGPHSGSGGHGYSSPPGHSSAGCPTPPASRNGGGSSSYGGSSPRSHHGSHKHASPSYGRSHGPPPSHAAGGGANRPMTPKTHATPAPVHSTPTAPITGTCDFWRTHPSLVWGILDYWSTVGLLFELPATIFFGCNLTVPQALGCTRTDGYGALIREGTACFLNSLSSHTFPYTTQQVKDAFVAGLASEKAAAAQAERFRVANEGHYKND